MHAHITPLQLIILIALIGLTTAVHVPQERVWYSSTGARWESRTPGRWETITPAGKEVAIVTVTVVGLADVKYRVAQKCFGGDTTAERSLEWTFGDNAGTLKECDGRIEKSTRMLRANEKHFAPYPPEIETALELHRNTRKI